MQDISMKQTSISIPISERDYPRAPRQFSSHSSMEISVSTVQTEDDVTLVEPLAGPEYTIGLDKLRSEVRSDVNLRNSNDLLAEFGVQSNWSKLSDIEIHIRASELIEKFNREGIEYPSFWNSLV